MLKTVKFAQFYVTFILMLIFAGASNTRAGNVSISNPSGMTQAEKEAPWCQCRYKTKFIFRKNKAADQTVKEVDDLIVRILRKSCPQSKRTYWVKNRSKKYRPWTYAIHPDAKRISGSCIN